MNLNFKVDVSEIQNGLNLLIEKHKLAAKSAMRKTVYRVAYDAIFDAPTPPLEWGTLRGAHSIVVTGGTPEKSPIDSPKNTPKNISGKELVKPDVEISEPYIADMKPIEGRVGFNVPYALNQHENHTPDGYLKDGPASAQAGDVGSKFLEKKIVKNEAIYWQLFAKFYAQEMKL